MNRNINHLSKLLTSTALPLDEDVGSYPFSTPAFDTQLQFRKY
ncbi:hypothetical protein PI33_gp077 [Escherichia phage ECML-4]|uniref:Uncharacterized protein n=1 Tax=Escherichia phage ECML-4 TaxID=1204523 RepID=I7B671_9CAUD|nr:hypothetical protein PI33_gp077 [Escherichia phage ECML-4]AFO10312.1 hypothetical protein [Escherichia phage ECML-4]